MKKYCVFILLAVSTQIDAQSSFQLNGKINGLKEGWLYLYHTGPGEKRMKDSTAIVNGSFRFTGNITEPDMAYLSLKEEKRNEANSTSFFIEPKSMQIELTPGAFDDAKITGSTMQDQYAALVLAKKQVEIKYMKQLDSLRTEKDHDKNAEIRERLAPYFSESNQEDFKFFAKYPSSMVTAYMMRFHGGDLSLDSMQHYYDKLGPVVQQSAAGKYVLADLSRLRAGSPGSMAKNFTTVDINGNKLSLSDFKGKYVLIDFWASWCVPCRKGNPHLKEVYAKYKSSGFEILGVADDDRAEAAWKEAVAKDGIGIWRHVRRGLQMINGEFDRSTDISDNFGIHSLPTKILANPTGKIIGRYSEDEVPLDKKLAEVFGLKGVADNR